MKGDSCVLMLEELEDALQDLGTLGNTISEVYLEDERAAYARTWYQLNLSLSKTYLIFLCTYLSKITGKEQLSGFFEILSAGTDPLESYDYLQDSYNLHDHVLKEIDTTFLAYSDVVEKDRVVQVMVTDLKKNLKLMAENLNLIQCA
jgi:hypothetical protein